MTAEETSFLYDKEIKNTDNRGRLEVSRRLRRLPHPRFTQKQVSEFGWMRTLCMSLLAAYIPSFFDGSEYTVEGRYWEWFAQHPWWQKLYKRFNAEIVYQVPLEKGKQYILSSHPHGVMSIHHWHYLCNREFASFFPGNKKRHLGASLVFKIPLFREWMQWGGIVDADASLAHNLLSEGYSMLALSGGISEQVRAAPGKHVLFIKKRLGIFKLSLQYGLPIVPCWNFGENEMIQTYSFAQGLRNWLADKWRLPLWIGHGIYGTLLPYPKQLSTYVGRPLQVEKVLDPTREQVLTLQNRYIEEMHNIFNKYKKKHGFEHDHLEFIHTALQQQMEHLGFKQCRSGEFNIPSASTSGSELPVAEPDVVQLREEAEIIVAKPFARALTELYFFFVAHAEVGVSGWCAAFGISQNDWLLRLSGIIPKYNADQDPGFASWCVQKLYSELRPPADFTLNNLIDVASIPRLSFEDLNCTSDVLNKQDRFLESYHKLLAAVEREELWRDPGAFSNILEHISDGVDVVEEQLDALIPFELQQSIHYCVTQEELEACVDLLLELTQYGAGSLYLNAQKQQKRFLELVPRLAQASKGIYPRKKSKKM